MARHRRCPASRSTTCAVARDRRRHRASPSAVTLGAHWRGSPPWPLLAAVAGGPGPADASDDHPAKLVVDLTTPPVVDPQDLASFALSPDGTQVVATGVVDGRSQLLVRGLDSATSRPVPGTVGGMYPFWSPDGRSARLLRRRLSPTARRRRRAGPAAGEGHRRRRRFVERGRAHPVRADPGQSDFPHVVGRRTADQR